MPREKTYIIENPEARFLGEYLSPKKSLNQTEMEFITEIMRFDEILYNKSHKTSLGRPYKIKDMIAVQKLLQLFNILELIKSKEHIVNCRALLHNYLYSGYSLQSCFLNHSNSKLSFETNIDIDCDLIYGDKCYTYFSEKNSLSYPSSIRKYFECYLSDHIYKPSCEYKIISSIPSTENKKHKTQPRFYLPISHIPEFLLAFEYYDARIFPSSYERYTDVKVRRRKKDIDKKKTYESTLQHIKSFLENTEASDSNTNKYTLNKYEKLYHIYRLDNTFLFRKLDFIINYYNAYNSDIFLNQILSCFSLTYRESMNLKSTINELIWNDVTFMRTGLQNSCIDFMLPFDINFQFELFQTPAYSHDKGIDGLKQVIDKCKKEAQAFWKIDFPFDFSNLLILDNKSLANNSFANKSLDIRKTQDKIIDILNQNAFFLNYYLPLLEDMQNCHVLLDASQQPIPFDILKELLPQ